MTKVNLTLELLNQIKKLEEKLVEIEKISLEIEKKQLFIYTYLKSYEEKKNIKKKLWEL